MTTKTKRKEKKKLKKEIRRIIDINLTNLNNKGRKGKYYKVHEKGKKTKYYKYRKGIDKKIYLEYFKRGIVSKRGGVKGEKVKKEIRIDKIAKKYPEIEKITPSGYAEYTIRNAKRLTPQSVKESYKFLLMNKDKKGDGKALVRDPELIDLLCRQENVDRWKHRIGYEVIAKNEKEETLMTITPKTIKSLGEIKAEVIDNIEIGEDYKAQYIKIEEKISKSYNVNTGAIREGKIAQIKIRLTFRKATR